MRQLYFIPVIADVSTEIFDRSTQTSSLTIRKSNDGLSCILSFDEGREPFEFVTKGYGPYTKDEMLSYIDANPDDWSDV